MVREEIDVINVDAGVDAMKIRTEPRSTCTTKVVGVGVPQFSAIQNVAKTCKARKCGNWSHTLSSQKSELVDYLSHPKDSNIYLYWLVTVPFKRNANR
ncbi:IMP dehydrogenase / GMP reductase domain family protein [Brugia pahangi]